MPRLRRYVIGIIIILLVAGCTRLPERTAPQGSTAPATSATTLHPVRYVAFDDSVSLLTSDLYAQYPELRLERVALPAEAEADPLGALRYLVESGQVDLIVGYPDMPALGSAGLLRDLEPFLVQQPGIVSTDLVDVDALRQGGRLLYLPMVLEPPVVYYNADRLRTAGQWPLPAGWDWEQLRAVAAAARSAPDGPGVATDYLGTWMEAMVLAQAGSIREADPVLLGDVLRFFATLAGSDRTLYAPRPGEADLLAAANQFREGQVALYVAPLGSLNTGTGALPFAAGVAPLPRRPEGWTPATAVSVGMAAGAAEPEWAWRVMAYLAGPEGAPLWARNGRLPAARSADLRSAWLEGTGGMPGSEELLGVRYRVVAPALAGTPERQAYLALGQAVRAVMAAEYAPDETLRRFLAEREQAAAVPEVTAPGVTAPDSTATAPGPGTPPAPPDSAPAPQNPVVPADPAPASGVRTLRIAMQSSYLVPLIAAFEQRHPDVRVERMESPVAHAERQQWLSEGKVDVVDANYVNDMNPTEVLIPLDPLMARDQFNTSPFGSLLDAGRLQGKQYLIPVAVSTSAIVYNVDLFGRAGVPLPSRSWTWEGFRLAAARITANAPAGERGLYAERTNGGGLVYALALDASSPRTISRATFTEAATLLRTMIDRDGSVLFRSESELIAPWDDFRAGRVAMIWSDLSSLAWAQRPSAGGVLPFRWDVVPLPHHPDRDPAIRVGTHQFGLPAASPSRDLAWEFLRFAAGPEGADVLAKANMLPSYRSAAARQTFLAQNPAPGLAAFFDLPLQPNPTLARGRDIWFAATSVFADQARTPAEAWQDYFGSAEDAGPLRWEP